MELVKGVVVDFNSRSRIASIQIDDDEIVDVPVSKYCRLGDEISVDAHDLPLHGYSTWDDEDQGVLDRPGINW
jgi:hypothetical protein